MELKNKTKQVLSNPEQVLEAINKLWNNFPKFDKARENMFAMYLNTKNELICIELHAQGTIDTAIVYPREIIRKGLFCNAAALILIHNHPSGNNSPSKDDRVITDKVKEACQLMDIQLLDHIIIGDNNHYSYQSAGLI